MPCGAILSHFARTFAFTITLTLTLTLSSSHPLILTSSHLILSFSHPHPHPQGTYGPEGGKERGDLEFASPATPIPGLVLCGDR